MSLAERDARLRLTTRAADDSSVDATARLATADYVGLVTRAVAFALDAALVNLAAILTSAVVALALSVVTVPDGLRALAIAAGGAAYLLWTAAYFVGFWSTTGQTPGSGVLSIRVRADSGEILSPRRALVRFVGLLLAALPLGAGFLPILLDDRRRGLHDLLARTVVVRDFGAADFRSAARSPSRDRSGR
jgi:uncharacterized RDD family membrane protein YckC